MFCIPWVDIGLVNRGLVGDDTGEEDDEEEERADELPDESPGHAGGERHHLLDVLRELLGAVQPEHAHRLEHHSAQDGGVRRVGVEKGHQVGTPVGGVAQPHCECHPHYEQREQLPMLTKSRLEVIRNS